MKARKRVQAASAAAVNASRDETRRRKAERCLLRSDWTKSRFPAAIERNRSHRVATYLAADAVLAEPYRKARDSKSPLPTKNNTAQLNSKPSAATRGLWATLIDNRAIEPTGRLFRRAEGAYLSRAVQLPESGLDVMMSSSGRPRKFQSRSMMPGIIEQDFPRRPVDRRERFRPSANFSNWRQVRASPARCSIPPDKSCRYDLSKPLSPMILASWATICSGFFVALADSSRGRR